MKKSFKILFISVLTLLISIIGISVKAYEYPKAGFIRGSEFNTTVRDMALAIDPDKGLEIIKHVVHADEMPDGVNAQNVSHVGGSNQGAIYVWITDDTLYYWSNAENLEVHTDASNMFNGFSKVEDIEIDFTGANSSTIAGMFQNCSSLKSIDLTNFNTSYVTDMTGLFSDCTSLTSIKFGAFDTYRTTNMTAMFSNCISLETLDLSSFYTLNVTNMTAMFNNCISLKNINLSSFNTSNVTNMTAMFNGLSSIEEIDIKSFSSSSVTSAGSMFTNCPKLKTIYATSDFDLTGLSTTTIFGGSVELVGDHGTEYIIDENNNHTRISNEFAHLDGGESNHGYFSTNKGTVTVTFMSDNSVFDTKQLTQYDRIIQEPGEAVPTKNGYTFVSWCSDSELNNEFDFNTRIGENTTLYAKFVKNITFTFISNHGTIVVKDKTGANITNQGIAPGETMYITVTPESGYKFSSMVINGINGTHIEYVDPTTQNYVIENYDELTFTATFVRRPQLIWPDLQGASGLPGYAIATDTNTGAVLSPPVYEDGKEVTITAVANQGYKFSKFKLLDENFNVLVDDITSNPYNYVFNTSNGFVSVNPCFVQDKHNVYYKYKDTTVYKIEVIGGNKVDASTAPTTNDLKGYTVKGWYSDSELTIPFDFDNKTITEETYIYGDIEATEAFTGGDWFNYKIKLAAGNNLEAEDITNHTDNSYDSNIIRIERSEEKPGDEVQVEYISTGFSYSGGNIPFIQYPEAYVWYDNGTIYWWSEAENLSFISGANTFYGLSNVESIDMTGMVFDDVTDMSNMFTDDKSLQSIDVTSFDTSKVTKMNEMFLNCEQLQDLDLTSFSSEALEEAYSMFYGCSNLRKIFTTSNFDLTGIDNIKMFMGCNSLEGMLGTVYNEEHTGNSYGHLDGGTSNPGYFSENVKVKLTYMLYGEKVHETEVLKGSEYVYNAEPETDAKHYFNGWYYNYENGVFNNIVRFHDRFLVDTTMYGFIDENLELNVVDSPYGDIIFKVGDTVIDPANGVAPETYITVSVEPHDTHKFLKLIVDGTEFTELPYENNVWADMTFEAVFEEKPIITVPDNTDPDNHATVTITDGTGNEITNGHADIGQPITIGVEPDENYKLEKVIITDENGNETEITPDQLPYSHIITGNITIEPVTSELPVIDIGGNEGGEDSNGTVAITDNNGNPINNGSHVEPGTEININVTPNEPYEVGGVNIVNPDTGEVITTLTEEPYTYKVDGPIKVEPIYNEKPVINIPDGDGTVTITDSNGNPVNNGDHVPSGTEITINVTPDDNHTVGGVKIVDPDTGEVITTLTEEPYTYKVDGPIKVEPIYNEKPNINVPSDVENGTVTITDSNGNPIDGPIDPGTQVNIDVKPDDGYEVEKVIITDENGNKTEIDGKDLPYQYTVTGNITVEPVIVEKKVDVNLPKEDENSNGKVTIKDKDGNEITDGKIKQGDEITIDVTPKEGYVVDKVIIKDKDGNVIETIPASELPKKYKVNGPITIEPVYKNKYEILSGDNQTYVKGSKKDITIKSNGELIDLTSIEIDNGNTVDPSNYELESGSTILTLKSSFLEESSLGKHTITFKYKDGSVDATLNITDKDESEIPTPNTGDKIILYTIIFIISSIMFITSYILIKRRYN